VLAVAVAVALSACVSLDHRYQFSISRPVPDMFLAEIQWQTAVDLREDADWEKKVMALAEAAIREEFRRRGLPCETVVVGKPTPYIGDWVVVHAAVANLPEEELRRKETSFWKNHPDGRPMPPAIHRGRGEFVKEAPANR
jgi:hypothetical protein